MSLFGQKGEKIRTKNEKKDDKREIRQAVVFSYIFLNEMIEKWIQNR